MNTETNHYSGPNSSQRVRIIGNEWPANQTTQIDSVYIQFAASPKFGGQFNVSSISLDIAASGINTMKANIYYSTNPEFTNPTQVNYTTTDTSGNNYLSITDLQTVNASSDIMLNTGDTIYLRVYPWVDNDPQARTGKYFDIQNVIISGTSIGITADPPNVTTAQLSNVSTTFATSGGNISNDGGAPVLARGVVWDTTASPTIKNNKTNDGTGAGAFISQATGLTPGTMYFLRAYATNDAGTAYGEEFTFTTLDSLLIPTVTTTEISNILVKSAESGGEVLAWGGDTVSARGVCWNTTGNPTISDSKTLNGSGLGVFVSTLFPLEPTTTYYVRAYATNRLGTAYRRSGYIQNTGTRSCNKKSCCKRWQWDYTTVQAAFDDVPDFYTGQYIISVKNGVYYKNYSFHKIRLMLFLLVKIVTVPYLLMMIMQVKIISVLRDLYSTSIDLKILQQ